MEAEKSQELPSASWGLGRINGVISVQVRRLRTRRASGGGTSLNAAAADPGRASASPLAHSATSNFLNKFYLIFVLVLNFFFAQLRNQVPIWPPTPPIANTSLSD